MKTRIAIALLLSACALLLSACAIDDDLAELDSEVTITNQLSAANFASSKLAAKQIAGASLASNSPQIRALVSSSAGRATFGVIVSCALPVASSVTATDTGGTSYTFGGSLNLAPAWASAAPTVSARRWVTACVLARVNIYGLSVPVSLRHDSNIALLATNAEKAAYPTAEAAYYGDLFGPTTALYACASQLFAPDDLQHEAIRSCARSSNGWTTQCGFDYAWFCGTSQPGHPAACTDTAAPYGLCRGSITTYTEVVSVFSQP